MKKKNLFIGLLLVAGQLTAQKLPQLGIDKIEDVVAAMTLDEKVHLVTGLPEANWQKHPSKDVVIVAGVAGRTWEISRLGIPITLLADGPAGLRINPIANGTDNPHYCTAFPTATALASSWNTSLVENVGKAMGNEVLEYGCDVLLAPAINIQRNPLCGRNFEYYSEDPFITGKMGAAMVRGIQSNGVGTSVKHFAANNQETNRREINENISQRALREIYLKGFEITIKEAQPWTIMSSYNGINGYHSAENKDLLTTILRNEWGFEGIVTTDWWSGTDYANQMYAGNDLMMPGDYQREDLLKAVRDRRLDEKILDRNVTRILQYILKTPQFRKYQFSNKPNLVANANTARIAAEEAVVLLKNKKSTLPLNKVKNIALFGKTSYHFIAGGTGSGEVNYKHAISLKEGIETAGYKLVKPLEEYYTHYTDSIITNSKEENKKYIVDFIPEIIVNENYINSLVKLADVAIVTIGRNMGEGQDKKEADYFLLSSEEQDLIKNVSKAFKAAGKKTIVILNIGGVIETATWKEYPDAILVAWQTGQEGGTALANILKGSANPSGKLAVSYPIKYADVPSSSTFPGIPIENPLQSFYNEGIYVGYRYYDSFAIDPSYEFGYGLSYTNFNYSAFTQSTTNFKDKIKVLVTVTNTGKIAGKEIVQLYLSSPQDKIEKPLQELKDFAKTRLLKPGESEVINFTINEHDLSSFWSGISAWVADAGIYEIRIGSSSRAIQIKGVFSLDEERITEKVNYALQPNIYVKELSTRDK